MTSDQLGRGLASNFSAQVAQQCGPSQICRGQGTGLRQTTDRDRTMPGALPTEVDLFQPISCAFCIRAENPTVVPFSVMPV
jgi:hypothetical protein